MFLSASVPQKKIRRPYNLNAPHMSPKMSLPFSFYNQNCMVIFLPYVLNDSPITFSSSLIWSFNNIRWKVQICKAPHFAFFPTSLLLPLRSECFSHHPLLRHPQFMKLLVCDTVCWFSIVSIATGYGLDGPGIESWCVWGFHTCPSWPLGPPSLHYNGYRDIPGGKAAGAWFWPPTPI